MREHSCGWTRRHAAHIHNYQATPCACSGEPFAGTARDALLLQLGGGQAAEALVDGYAHGLAEVVRSKADPECLGGGCDSCAARMYADLIDPEASDH